MIMLKRPKNAEHEEPEGRRKRADLGVAQRKHARVEQLPPKPDVIILDSDDSDGADPDEAFPIVAVRPAASVPARPTASVPAHLAASFPARPAASVPAHPAASVPARPTVLVDRNRSDNVGTKRLMKELSQIRRQHGSNPDPVFTVELVNDNLHEWNVRLLKVDPESKLARDMRELHIPAIQLNLVFPENFPFGPPFMRVVEPRIQGGYVMDGGAICMELLTPTGWASTYSVEGLVIQFAATVVKGNGRVSRAKNWPATGGYSRARAEATFRSLVKSHGKDRWFTPKLSEG